MELYIARCPAGASNYQCAAHHLPNTSHYLQTTADSDRTYLDLLRSDDQPASYIVGVYSPMVYSAFQISATFESSILDLQAGIAAMDHVRKGEVDYFSFFLEDAHASLKISLTTVSLSLGFVLQISCLLIVYHCLIFFTNRPNHSIYFHKYLPTDLRRPRYVRLHQGVAPGWRQL